MSSTTRTIALTITGTVASGVILTILTWAWSSLSTLNADVARLKDQEVFYHGRDWPPSNGGARVAP